MLRILANKIAMNTIGIAFAVTVFSSGAQAQGTNLDFIQHVIDLVNAERAANGVAEMRVSGYLAQSAQSHADDQSRRNYDAHNTPEGVTPRDRMMAVGYDPGASTGENIYNAWGDQYLTSPEGAMAWWMNSPGHRANILNPVYTEIGVGLAITTASGKHIYVQNFGSAATTGVGGWGAIAYSPGTTINAAVHGKTSSADAAQAAMALCSGAAQDCVLALSYRHACGVVKRDPVTGVWGAGLAGGKAMPAINAAGNYARARCVQAGGQNCNELVVASCSQ